MDGRVAASEGSDWPNIWPCTLVFIREIKKEGGGGGGKEKWVKK